MDDPFAIDDNTSSVGTQSTYAPNDAQADVGPVQPSAPYQPEPPSHHYYQYRQPPTWQHASIAGFGDSTVGGLISDVTSGLFQILAGGALGYLLGGRTVSAGAAGALAILGAAQVSRIPQAGGTTRLFVAAGAFGGAYYLLRSQMAGGYAEAYANEGPSDVKSPWLKPQL